MGRWWRQRSQKSEIKKKKFKKQKLKALANTELLFVIKKFGKSQAGRREPDGQGTTYTESSLESFILPARARSFHCRRSDRYVRGGWGRDVGRQWEASFFFWQESPRGSSVPQMPAARNQTQLLKRQRKLVRGEQTAAVHVMVAKFPG